MAATVSRTFGGVVPDSRPRCAASWFTTPSASGSLNGTPSSKMSTPDLVEGQRQFARGGQVGIARADIDDETLFALAPQAREAFLNSIHYDFRFTIYD